MNETYPKLGESHTKFHKNYDIPQFKDKLFQGYEEAGIGSRLYERRPREQEILGFWLLNLEPRIYLLTLDIVCLDARSRNTWFPVT